MIKNFATHISKIILVTIFVILSFSQKELYGARDSGVERVRTCTNGKVEDFQKFHSKELKEMDYDLSNPICIINFAAAYASIKTAIGLINSACQTGSQIPRVLPSLAKDIYELGKAAKKATKDAKCMLAFGGGISIASLGSVGPLLTLHTIANEHYNKVRVCGSDWKAADIDKNVMASDVDGSYSKEVKTYAQDPVNKVKGIEDKKNKEWFFGGKEFEDKPAVGEACIDPSDNKPQKYYLRGLSSNFMCEKYNPKYHSSKIDEYKKAYKCCLERSQNYICLEKVGVEFFNGLGVHSIYSGEHIFCKGGSKCSFKNNVAVIFEAYKRDNGRLICAKSYSLCPYNFAIGGGSSYPDYYLDTYGEEKKIITSQNTKDKHCPNAEIRDAKCKFNSNAGKLKNYCQYYRHCTVVEARPYVADLEILNPYYSKACIDFIGDSQNGVEKEIDSKTGISYNGGLLFGEQKSFSAPIVQCFKDTMKNIFTNTAGHSRCLNGSFGNSKNECKDSNGADSYFRDVNFIWKKGNKVKENSLFEVLQKRLKMIITTVLVISVTFFGFKILLGKLDLSNKKEILVYIIKIGFVVYFVNGTAWKDIFFDGVYNGSSEISRIFFKINSGISGDDKELQCNFGSQYDKNGIKIKSTVNYPKGSEYLMVWDTLDCKIMQYLNYGPGFDASTVFLLIVAAFFTGGIGLIIALSIFVMAFCLIMATIRAMHIFISSAIAIIIYIFISPIIIPLVLFEKTKNIFDSWLSQLMSFTLSPIVLFAYLAIFISLSENIMYGGAKDFNNGRVDCNEYCISKDSGEKLDKTNCEKEKNSETINPLDQSIACLLNFNDFDKDAGFAFFGIALPSIGKLLEDGKVEIRVLLIIKSALFLFILAQFMDEIPSITGRLTGEIIDVKTTGYMDALKKFTSTMRGIQKRSARLVKGAGLSQLENAKKIASEDKGEKKDDKSDNGGVDIVSSEDKG